MKDYLKGIGAWFVKYWSGSAMTKQGNKKFTKDGIPDLLVCYCGLFLGIELKAPRGHPSDLQWYHLKEIDKAGGIAVLLYPKDFEQFKCLMKDIEHDELPISYNLYDVYPFVKNAVDIEEMLQAKIRKEQVKDYGKESS